MKELFQKLSNFFNSSREERMVNMAGPEGEPTPPPPVENKVDGVTGKEAGTETTPGPPSKITSGSTEAPVIGNIELGDQAVTTAEGGFDFQAKSGPMTPEEQTKAHFEHAMAQQAKAGQTGTIEMGEPTIDPNVTVGIKGGISIAGADIQVGGGKAVAQAKPKASAPLAAIPENPPE